MRPVNATAKRRDQWCQRYIKWGCTLTYPAGPRWKRTSVKHLALALLCDELIEIGHHVVAPGNQRLDLVLAQIRLRRVEHLVVTELSKLGEHLAVALDEVFGVLQVVLKPEAPAEIDPPNLPILSYKHIR